MCRKAKRLGLFGIASVVAMLFFLAPTFANNKPDKRMAAATSGIPATGTAPRATSPVVTTEPPVPASGVCVPQAPIEGQANLFRNPSFELGEIPWCTPHPCKPTRFQVTQDYSHTGRSSALLRMRVPPEEEGHVKVYYLVQEVCPKKFPEVVSGYYRVENWHKCTSKQYLQFVVIVFDASNLAVYPNHQIRYPLAGIREEPFHLGNAHFVFMGNEEPRTGRWVHFERNIEKDFQELWGSVPEGFSKIRVLFEVRFDDRPLGSGPGKADVYYDDLYIGPSSKNPNPGHQLH